MTLQLAMFDDQALVQSVSTIRLPKFGKTVRYWDDFSECTREISDFDVSSTISIHDDGRVFKWNMDSYSEFQRSILKAVVYEILTTLDVSSSISWASSFRIVSARLGANLVEQFCITKPFDIKGKWEAFVFPFLTAAWEGNALKKLLQFLCAYRVGDWAPEFSSLVSGLSVPREDLFRVVRSGECFVPAEHLHLIYEYLDDLSSRAAKEKASYKECRIATAVILADQHAFRPGTISRIKIDDVRLHEHGPVHVSGIMVKKHDGSERIRVTRRIKREWCPIVREFFNNRERAVPRSTRASNRLLSWTPSQVTAAISRKLEIICGERWTATDLRHTAAQRMVDAGASADQLAEFLCQNSTLVGNVYFEQSPSQAARINEALAISPIYARIPEVHRTKTIDKDALLIAPEEYQIGGAPHGIPIAGIGSCGLGQSLCDKNPVLSCYGCRKFLAVNDAEIHENVVSSLRPVVLQFEAASRGHMLSPAYTQLRRTLTKAMAIANAIRESETVAE